MIARMLLLRSAGVRLEVCPADGAAWSREGYLEMEARDRHRLLRSLGSAPEDSIEMAKAWSE